MRTLIISLICLCSFVAQSQSQSKSPTIITINAKDSDIYINKPVRYGERVKFKIENVNVFKISGLTTTSGVDLDFETPAIFSGVTESGLATDLLTDKLQENIEEFNDLLTQNQKIAEDMMKKLKIQIDTIKLIIEKQNEFRRLFEEYNATLLQIRLMANLEESLIEKLSDSIFIPDTSTLKKNCKDEFLSIYPEEDGQKARGKFTESYSAVLKNFVKMKLIYEELIKMQKLEPLKMKGSLMTDDKLNSLTINEAVVKLELRKYFEDEFKFAQKVYQQLYNDTIQKQLFNKVNKGIDLYFNIKNSEFCLYTDSEPLNNDEVTVTPKLIYANGKVAKEFPAYNFTTRCHLKVNFSTGYLLSFIGNENYSLLRDSSGNITGAKSSPKSNLTHSLGALAHVYYTLGRNIDFSISTGLSMTNNANLGFYAGISCLFLEKKHRIVITGGYSAIQVQVLNKTNLIKNEGESYKFISSSNNELIYNQVYKGAWFIGLTYNLSANK